MQRILSMETSRRSDFGSGDFVSKKLCCSVLLTIAFFSIIGGFLLGRFVTDQTLNRIRYEMNDITKKLNLLDNNLKKVFYNNAELSNCSWITTKLTCEHLKNNPNIVLQKSAQETLDLLNFCFNNG